MIAHTELTGLSNQEVRDIFARAYRNGCTGFLKWFAAAAVSADDDDFSYLRLVALHYIEKYNLQ